MSQILKFNNQVVHKVNNRFVKKFNDEYVQCGSFIIPVGSIIRIDFNGDGMKEKYRVLECTRESESVRCKVLSMFSWNTTRYYPYNEAVTAEFSNGAEGLKFKNSLVDKELDSFYEQLKYNAKQCIMPMNRPQKMWNYTYIPTEEEYDERESGYIYGIIDDNRGYYKLTDTGGRLDMGYKNVSALSLDDIFDYYNIKPSNGSSSNEEHTSPYVVGQTIYRDTDKIYFNAEREDDFVEALKLLNYVEDSIATNIDMSPLLRCGVWNDSGIVATRDRRDSHKTIYGIIQIGHECVPLYSTENNSFNFDGWINFDKGFNNLDANYAYAWIGNCSSSENGEVAELYQEDLWNGIFIGQTNDFIPPVSIDTITYGALYNLLWDSSSSDNINKSVWLSDAAYRQGATENENLNKNAAFFANRQYGNLINYHYSNIFEVRPVFTFDLNKLVDVYNMEIEIED